MSSVIVSCTNLKKYFNEGGNFIEVLKDINFSINQGETLAILGESGSGKSTLLHLLSGLDTPSDGQVFWQNENINQLSEKQKCKLRNEKLGFIYQFHHLLSEFTALENTAIPLLIQGVSNQEAEERAAELLKQVGLANRLTHKPGQLSGGERQRVAIARALVTKPKCVLADEPTGNLDQNTALVVLEVMLSLQNSINTSFIVVTHNHTLAKRLNKFLYLENGMLSHESQKRLKE
ncbi:MAG: lipoprotein releasing system, ATP-binding protein [Gammaproteobacteria bacterium RIFCSPHIGHO2_12_FULL_35_23]|nr:MAG: lipoprotein releasing system, ATP-binding protein [Gammaproteobacteria bacterium RIFCSPHIGHO2_12_FULL_35_23]